MTQANSGYKSLTSNKDISLVRRRIQQVLEVINVHANECTHDDHGTHDCISWQRSSHRLRKSFRTDTHSNTSNVRACTFVLSIDHVGLTFTRLFVRVRAYITGISELLFKILFLWISIVG